MTLRNRYIVDIPGAHRTALTWLRSATVFARRGHVNGFCGSGTTDLRRSGKRPQHPFTVLDLQRPSGRKAGGVVQHALIASDGTAAYASSVDSPEGPVVKHFPPPTRELTDEEWMLAERTAKPMPMPTVDAGPWYRRTSWYQRLEYLGFPSKMRRVLRMKRVELPEPTLLYFVRPTRPQFEDGDPADDTDRPTGP